MGVEKMSGYFIVKYWDKDGSSGFLFKAYKSQTAAARAASDLAKRAWIAKAEAQEVVF